MIPTIQLFDKFSDLPVTHGELREMINSIVELFTYVNLDEKKLQPRILALNEIHWKIFQHLENPKCNFYRDVDSRTRVRIIRLIYIEREQRNKSWIGIMSTIIHRVNLYPRLFKITDADIKQHKHFVECGAASFKKIALIGLAIVGGLAAKKVYDLVLKNGEEKK